MDCGAGESRIPTGDPADPQPPECACSCDRLHLPLDNDRERECKCRALADLRLDPDLAAVHLDDPLRDSQSQAGATLLAGTERV